MRLRNRKDWKRLKLELRGTYQRRDRWRLEQAQKRVRAAADLLAVCLGTTGRELLREMEAQP